MIAHTHCLCLYIIVSRTWVSASNKGNTLKTLCQPQRCPHDHMATTYGVVRDPILNTLQYFHTTEGLLPDIMHDVLEEVLPMCTKHLLSHLIEESLINVSELNRRIESYQFGPIEGSNRPKGNITTNHLVSGDLRQSGTCTVTCSSDFWHAQYFTHLPLSSH